MALEGYTFDFMKVPPGMDAMLYHAMNGGDSVVPGYGTEMKVTNTGLTARVGVGAMILKGRFIRNTTVKDVAIPANSTGFVVLTIDLTKNNSFSGTPGDDNYKPINNQIRLERVASLTQQDLFNGGSIFHFPLAKYTSNGSTITINDDYLLDRMVKKQSKYLFKGKDKTAKLSEGSSRFNALIVTIGVQGVLMTGVFSNEGKYYDSSINGINLYNDTTSKGYDLFETELTINENDVKVIRTKSISSSGTVTTTVDVNIISVIGVG